MAPLAPFPPAHEWAAWSKAKRPAAQHNTLHPSAFLMCFVLKCPFGLWLGVRSQGSSERWAINMWSMERQYIKGWLQLIQLMCFRRFPPPHASKAHKNLHVCRCSTATQQYCFSKLFPLSGSQFLHRLNKEEILTEQFQLFCCFCLLVFWDRVLCIPDWTRIHHVVEAPPASVFQVLCWESHLRL